MPQVLRPKKVTEGLSKINVNEVVVSANEVIVEDVNNVTSLTNEVVNVVENNNIPSTDVSIKDVAKDINTLVDKNVEEGVPSTVASIYDDINKELPLIDVNVSSIADIAVPVPASANEIIISDNTNVAEVTDNVVSLHDTKVNDISDKVVTSVDKVVVEVASDVAPIKTNNEEVTPSIVKDTSEVVDEVVSTAEVHVQPTQPVVQQPVQPEISDALQKLLEMKVNKTLANAQASLEEKEPTILNEVGEVVIAKPNLGKEIRVPKPIEAVIPQQVLPVENIPVINPQTANTTVQEVQPNSVPVTSVIPATTINNVNAQNNLQTQTTTVPVMEVSPKKSFLDKLLGF